jgi:hypothetical protein
MIARRWLDLTLVVLLAVSLTAVLLAHERDFLRKPFCAAVLVCPSVDNAEAWNKIAYDLGVGGLTSLVFYVLLVRLPDRQRRGRIKRSLTRRYEAFKKDLIATTLSVADRTYEYSLINKLLDHQKFRDYFKEPVDTNHNRWAIFLNNLDDQRILDIISIMEIFRAELTQVLVTTDIANFETSEFFKRLSAAIYSHRNATADYDAVKQLSSLLWFLLTGWDWVLGYRERDIVQDMIDSI